MNVFQKLESSQPTKPYFGFGKLKIGYHLAQQFRLVKNKFGKKTDGSDKSILVELKDQVIFLPQYFKQKLDDGDLRELNTFIENKEKVYIYFGGRVDETK